MGWQGRPPNPPSTPPQERTTKPTGESLASTPGLPPDHLMALALQARLMDQLERMHMLDGRGSTYSLADIYRRYADAVEGSIRQHQAMQEAEARRLEYRLGRVVVDPLC